MMRDDVERLLAEAARATTHERFDAGFADRVMERVEHRAERPDAMQALSAALARQARRTLPAVAAASLAISAWNWWTVRDEADSPLRAALGIESVTLTSALASGALVGAEELR